jgi:hypothetical protein
MHDRWWVTHVARRSAMTANPRRSPGRMIVMARSGGRSRWVTGAVAPTVRARRPGG